MSEVQMEFARIGQRIQEIEIKAAFLEKEVEEYKEATQTLHARLATLEEELRKLRRDIPEPNTPESKLASALSHS